MVGLAGFIVNIEIINIESILGDCFALRPVVETRNMAFDFDWDQAKQYATCSMNPFWTIALNTDIPLGSGAAKPRRINKLTAAFMTAATLFILIQE